jgi:hypothetical protein
MLVKGDLSSNRGFAFVLDSSGHLINQKLPQVSVESRVAVVASPTTTLVGPRSEVVLRASTLPLRILFATAAVVLLLRGLIIHNN